MKASWQIGEKSSYTYESQGYKAVCELHGHAYESYVTTPSGQHVFICIHYDIITAEVAAEAWIAGHARGRESER